MREKTKKTKRTDFTPTVFTREEKACAPTAFAIHYGYKQENIKGNRISGDDKFLIYALKKDSSAISYNNPGYVYDLITRKVLDGVTVLPYDLNENAKVDEEENFYNTLDELITGAELITSKKIPVEYVNVSYPKVISEENNNLRLFLEYILTEGQKFNHQFGFLNQDEAYLAKLKEAFKSSEN